jgi:uncharacterized protein YggE
MIAKMSIATQLISLSTLMMIQLFLVSPAAAQEPAGRPERMPPTIRVTGEAVVTVKPDQAQIDIGVLTQAQTSQAASAENARKLDAVLPELRAALGPTARIETVSYNLQPNYQYPRDGGRPTITGYTASNLVRVTLQDLSAVGKAIDVTTRSGANQIHRLQFMLKDEEAARATALREAAAKARVKAEALAEALGVKVVRLISVVEGGASVQPVRDVMMMNRAAEASAPTQVMPSLIEVHGTVTLTVEISQR